MNIFITGVSSGLGYALSLEYLQQGHTVWGISRRVPPIQHPNFHHQVCNLEHLPNIPQQLQSLWQQGTCSPSAFDVVLLNAAILPPIQTLLQTTQQQLEQAMTVNVWANKIIVDTLYQLMPTTKQIVAISSGASQNGYSGWGAYSVAKAALNTMIKTYAQEWPHCHFCSLAPGILHTPMQDYLCSDATDSEQFPSIARIKQTMKSGQMQSAKQTAVSIMAHMNRLRQLPSGDYADVRKLNE
jgi:benzil reductase ((S)-benzoin forming)